MFTLETPFWVYSKPLQKNILIKYTNIAAELIDEHKYIHYKCYVEFLPEEPRDERTI